MSAHATQQYTVVVDRDARNRLYVKVPFDPDELWGEKPRHHIAGSINGMSYRGVIQHEGDQRVLVLPPGWCRDRCVELGQEVVVFVAPEGPQRADLAPDIVAALEAEPEAGAFFDGLAQFYRRGYLTWIDGTKRRPEVRAQRIAEMVELLKAGIKHRPR